MDQHAQHRALVRQARAAIAALALGLVTADAALAAGPARCRLALVLALDVSSSVNKAEDALQRGGLAAALRNPEVQAAFLASPEPVALAVFEWSGRYHQDVMMDWRLMENPAALEAAANTIAQSRRVYAEFATAMGTALDFGGRLLTRAPACHAQTIDMAGDGINNDGYGPAAVYSDPAFDRITVNGLAVDVTGRTPERALVDYYRAEVLHGPGAFLEVARGFDDYARAIRNKLIREVSVPMIGAVMGP